MLSIKNILLFSILLISMVSFGQTHTKKEKKQDNTTVKILPDRKIEGLKGPDKQQIYEGAKGGLYYINKNGNKTYLQDTDTVIPDKKGPDGQPVYKGPQGGEYFYNTKGVKTYLRK